MQGLMSCMSTALPWVYWRVTVFLERCGCLENVLKVVNKGGKWQGGCGTNG